MRRWAGYRTDELSVTAGHGQPAGIIGIHRSDMRKHTHPSMIQSFTPCHRKMNAASKQEQIRRATAFPATACRGYPRMPEFSASQQHAPGVLAAGQATDSALMPPTALRDSAAIASEWPSDENDGAASGGLRCRTTSTRKSARFVRGSAASAEDGAPLQRVPDTDRKDLVPDRRRDAGNIRRGGS